ncbi:MAG: T9SS type A sorting domain-containing protein [Bacteroidetes bacterium]|nr:T9SS type A sorting domain-containing protein [Bacteroidota bacterium]
MDIHGEAGFLASGAELEVRTTGGKSILKKTIDPGKNRLDLSLNAIEWPSGIYIVSITSTTGNTIQRKVILIK